MSDLTPKQIVSALDEYIIGQKKAKKAVAVALRNRWRRLRLSEELQEEVAPKNIIMIGPTGVGKTEIARRLSALAGSPFLKIEASKFTEVGYVGRDVESMIRDLTEIGVNIVKNEKRTDVQKKAECHAEERLLELLMQQQPWPDGSSPDSMPHTEDQYQAALAEGRLEDWEIEVDVQAGMVGGIEIFSSSGGMEEVGMHIKEMMPGLFPQKTKKRRVKITEARRIFVLEEVQKLIDMDTAMEEAIKRVENTGIIFIDEIDKVAGRESSHGPDVSREGVQRDILPIIEGTTVVTKYGTVRTDHILFIAAGAFHATKPADLIPELQGRFPIRVTLNALTEDDFIRILTEPKNALSRQYYELLATDGCKITFTDDAIRKIAAVAVQVNERAENIGARRLHTIMERLLERISFAAPDDVEPKITIDEDYVRQSLADVVEDQDLSRYIL